MAAAVAATTGQIPVRYQHPDKLSRPASALVGMGGIWSPVDTSPPTSPPRGAVVQASPSPASPYSQPPYPMLRSGPWAHGGTGRPTSAPYVAQHQQGSTGGEVNGAGGAPGHSTSTVGTDAAGATGCAPLRRTPSGRFERVGKLAPSAGAECLAAGDAVPRNSKDGGKDSFNTSLTRTSPRKAAGAHEGANEHHVEVA